MLQAGKQYALNFDHISHFSFDNLTKQHMLQLSFSFPVDLNFCFTAILACRLC